MKKLLFVLVTLLIGFVSMAQTVTQAASTYTTKLDPKANVTYFRHIGTVADTMGVADSSWTYTVGVNNVLDALKQEVRVKLDEVSGTGKVAFKLKGKTFVQDSWTTITTVNYKGGGSDTTFYLNNATAKPYRFYQIEADVDAKTAQKLKVLEFEFSLYK